MTTLSRSTVSITEAGRIAGVSRRTVNNWIAHGKVECHRRAGGTVRVYVDSLFRAEEGATNRFTRGGCAETRAQSTRD